MKDDRLISLNAAIDALDKVAEMFPYRIPGDAKTYRQYNEAWSDAIDAAENALEALPPAQPTDRNGQERTGTDLISRQAAIETVRKAQSIGQAHRMLVQLPSAQPGQRYTEEELSVFAHGISLSLLSKRSAQHWRYDEDTATEIKFLERLYEKVSADMKGEQG